MAQATLTTLKAAGLDHIVFHVRDAERSKQFYMRLFGMEIDHEGPGQVFLRCGEKRVLALFEPRDGGEIHGGSEVNHLALKLESADYDQASSALKTEGIEFRGRAADPYTIYIKDPDGHTLQLITTDHGQRRQQEQS
jgi:catechol 2,3-dioxygenase-like lactoylglutathione lyase family enzyme